MSNQDDLLATNDEIERAIKKNKYGFLEDAQAAIAEVIEKSPMVELAAQFEKFFNQIYYDHEYTESQKKAFLVAVFQMPRLLGIEYLGAAKLISASSLVSRDIHADVLKICNITTDGEEGGFGHEYIPMSARGEGPHFRP